MPIKSYLVFPKKGEKDLLTQQLENLHGCEVTPSVNKEVLVLVTDTPNDYEEDSLLETLGSIKEIGHLSLVSGYSDNAKQEPPKNTTYDE